MKNILLKNALFLSDKYEIESGDIAVSEGEIIGVGKRLGDIVQGGFDRVINLKKNLVIPSLKNCHTHSAMALFRGAAEDLPLKNWLFDKIFPLEERLTEEDVYWGTRLAILEYQRNGITHAADMYFHPTSIKQAAIDAKFNIHYIGAVSDYGDAPSVQLDRLARLYSENKNGKYFKLNCLGFHAEYTCSDFILDELAKLSKTFKAPIFTHLSESRREVEDCQTQWKKTPFQRLISRGLFEFGGGVYHAVYPQENDIELFRKYGITVVSCPSSNLKLASGIAPLADYLENGITLALGTDGAASNNALDMFREMFLAAALQKGTSGDASQMPKKAVLKMTFEGAEKALGLENNAFLTVGSRADLAVLNMHTPSFQPENDLASGLIYNAVGKDVVLTMSKGEIVYENGKFPAQDAAEVFGNCKKILKRLRA